MYTLTLTGMPCDGNSRTCKLERVTILVRISCLAPSDKFVFRVLSKYIHTRLASAYHWTWKNQIRICCFGVQSIITFLLVSSQTHRLGRILVRVFTSKHRHIYPSMYQSSVVVYLCVPPSTYLSLSLVIWIYVTWIQSVSELVSRSRIKIHQHFTRTVCKTRF